MTVPPVLESLWPSDRSKLPKPFRLVAVRVHCKAEELFHTLWNQADLAVSEQAVGLNPVGMHGATFDRGSFCCTPRCLLISWVLAVASGLG